MKLLIVSAYYYPHPGGLERYVHELGTRLGRRLDVTILTCNLFGAPARERVDGVEIIRLDSAVLLGGAWAFPKPRELSMIQRAVADADIINTHTRFFPLTTLAAIFAQRLQKPLIHTEHGNGPVPHPNLVVRWCSRLYDQTLGRLVMRLADVVVAISRPGVAFAEHLGADSDTTLYLPNCVDFEEFRPGPTDWRKRHQVRDSEFLIAFVGRLIQAKGVQDLLHAVKDIADAHIVIVGDGPYRAALESLAGKLDVRVTFLGRQHAAEVLAVLRAADLFVNPSYAEGLPTSVLEAAAVGVPVIATAVGGTPDVVPPEDLVSPGDVRSIERLVLRKRSYYVREASIARKRRESLAERFSWEAIVDAYAGLATSLDRSPSQ